MWKFRCGATWTNPPSISSVCRGRWRNARKSSAVNSAAGVIQPGTASRWIGSLGIAAPLGGAYGVGLQDTGVIHRAG